MYSSNNCVWIWVILAETIIAQSTLKSDTLYLSHTDSIYFLKDSFILPATVNVYIDGKWVKPDSLEPIKGMVYWKNQLNTPTKAVISYRTLNTGLPIKVGPKWIQLPLLDSLAWQKPTDDFSDKSLVKHNVESDLFSSGTIHRQLNVSPFGGSDFSGGMRIQLNGKLTDDIMVSGILSDQDLPIQPEGTTRNLEDLQQVYLTVQHPDFTLDAGDIDFNYTHNNFININRKLIGLNNNFNFKNWNGTAVYATTRGRYRSIEFKGQDGNQGPYGLTSSSNSRDIIILAGSEKIWLDGKQMIRGKNYDYTIDYSQGEITFTPRQLIYDDADIFIEYQYIDFQYSRNMIGGAFEKEISSNGKITGGIFRERDQVDKTIFDTSTLDSLSNAGNKPVKWSGIIQDDNGDYYLNDSIYVYDPEKNVGDERYQVSFSYNTEGDYQRKISFNGKIYYEYVPETDQKIQVDLYSPFRTIIAPILHDLLFASGEWNLGDKVRMQAALAGSNVDQNSLSDKDDELNSSGSFRVYITADSIRIGSMQFGFSFGDWYKQKNFRPLGRDKSIRHRRFWNLDSVGYNEERQTELSLNLHLENISSTKLELAQINIIGQKRKRTKVIHTFEHPFFRRSNLEHYRVKVPQGLYSFTKGLLNFNTGVINPFIMLEMETDPNFKKYEIIGGGLNLLNRNTSWKSGIQLRDESVSGDNGEAWVPDSKDIIAFIDYSIQARDGWRRKLIVKHRLKTMSDQSSGINYTLGRLHVSFKLPTSPVNWELKMESEETFTEQRSIVYDSVGVGLGQYRYDNNFNTYVSDPNGPYIAYSVPTGDRNPTTVLEGLHRFIFDFGKLKNFPDLQFRSESRLNFRGDISEPGVIFNSSLNDSAVVRSRWNSRVDIDLKNWKAFQHIRFWTQIFSDLQGLDPRGNDLNQLSETGLEFTGKRRGLFQFRANRLYRSHHTQSIFSDLRNRSVSGTWDEVHFIIKANRNVELDAAIHYGHDIGEYQEKSFDATGLGVELNGRYFIGVSGRLQLRMEWNSIREKNKLMVLPPEALHGLPVGQNLQTHTRLQYLINRNISLVLSLNTIHNQRYQNMVTFLGEFRAYF